MKLNPAKCTFGAEEGKFLGYYVTNDGILPNPTKINDFLATGRPANLADAQGLNGKITALGRFISKSAEKAMPIFQTLKGCVDKSNFEWTQEAEDAMTQLKQTLRQAPMLACPTPRETLSVYLAASTSAVSAGLAVNRGGQQLPVYFVSRALFQTERNYPVLERLVLALVHAARRLRRYFQVHAIEVHPHTQSGRYF